MAKTFVGFAGGSDVGKRERTRIDPACRAFGWSHSEMELQVPLTGGMNPGRSGLGVGGENPGLRCGCVV